MPTHNVVLSEEHEALIADLVRSGEFRDAADVLQEGLKLVEESRKRDTSKEEELRVAIQAGLDDLDQGRFTTLADQGETTAHIRSLANRAAEMSSSGH